MDNLIEETRKLSNTLNVWDFSTILKLFTKYAHNEPMIRRQLVLEDYFNTTHLGNVTNYERDTQIIQRIFPLVEQNHIVSLLRIIGNEENRVRIVTKLLLNETRMSLKRPNNTVSSDEVLPKKPKLKSEISIPSSSSVDSTSTIIYTPELLTIEEDNSPKLNGVCDKDKPSSSRQEKSLENNIIHDEHDYSGNVNIPAVNADMPSLFEDEDVKLVEPIHEIKDLHNTQSYHLHNHLQEMFSNVPLEFIKNLCKRFKLNVRKPPTEHEMNILINLLSQTTIKKDTNKIVESVATSSTHPLAIPGPSTSVDPPLSDLLDTGHSTPTPVCCTAKCVAKNLILIPDDDKQESCVDRSDQFEELQSVLDQLHQDNIQEGYDEEDDVKEMDVEDVKEMDVEEDNSLVYRLMEMFPQACPFFIRDMCKGKKNNPGVLDELISQILEMDYPIRTKKSSPPRQLDFGEQLQIMKNILVDADPDYLQMHCERLINKPEELKEFIAVAVETHNYPTMKDFLRKQQISAQQKQYTTDFSIQKFIELIPQPFEYFNDSERKVIPLDYTSQHYALCYLRNKFPSVNLRIIRDCFSRHASKFLATCKELETVPAHKLMKSKRGKTFMPETIQNIPLLQEIAFYDHEREIRVYLDQLKLEEEIEWRQAKAAGLLNTCACCFDDEVMPKNVFCCESGCTFCKDCIRKGAEVAFGDGKLDFSCLTNCESHFSLQVLQAVLTPKMFSIIALKKQVEEVKAAGIEDLETCPFCDFATIPARDDKLFRCLNPECMKESCRMCKEPSHVPLRCDEVEKDNDVKARTYIENKMTEALLRTCYKCGMKFIKADGCNKMTCSCGALMCYVCGKPVKDYKHFNGLGGDQIKLCPLYSDTNKLHRDAVIKGAEDAKQEIGIQNPGQLKHDPTSDIQTHYKSVPNRNQIFEVPVANPFQGLDHNEILLQQRELRRFIRFQDQINIHHLVRHPNNVRPPHRRHP